MNLFLLDQAASTQAAAENPWGNFLMWGMVAVMFIAMYFFVLRPQRKKQKEEEEMRSSIEIGDDVTTIGGIVGKVIAIREDDDTFVLETGTDKTRIRFKKWAVSSIDTPEKQPKKNEKAEKKSKKSKDKDKSADTEEE